MTPPLTFLTSADELSARTVLIIQTGAADVLARAVESVCARAPEAAVTVLLQRNNRTRVPLRPGVEYLDNDGSKRELVRSLRARNFDAVFVLYTNQPGYWKLKLLPFALGARTLFAVDERLAWLPISLRNPAGLALHLVRRLPAIPISNLPVRQAARLAAFPAKLAYLFIYERLRAGRAPWKRGTHD
jgi:hypothetical protein